MKNAEKQSPTLDRLFSLRMTNEMHEKLASMAVEERRSLNAQINVLLEECIQDRERAAA